MRPRVATTGMAARRERRSLLTASASAFCRSRSTCRRRTPSGSHSAAAARAYAAQRDVYNECCSGAALRHGKPAHLSVHPTSVRRAVAAAPRCVATAVMARTRRGCGPAAYTPQPRRVHAAAPAPRVASLPFPTRRARCSVGVQCRCCSAPRNAAQRRLRAAALLRQASVRAESRRSRVGRALG